MVLLPFAMVTVVVAEVAVAAEAAAVAGEACFMHPASVSSADNERALPQTKHVGVV